MAAARMERHPEKRSHVYVLVRRDGQWHRAARIDLDYADPRAVLAFLLATAPSALPN